MKSIFKILSFIFLFTSAFTSKGQNMAIISKSYAFTNDSNVEISFDFAIENGWYLYGTTAVKGGPLAASFSIDSSADYEIIGTLSETETPHKKWDPAFKREVEYFEGEARLIQTIKPLTEGSFTVKGTIEYQVCNGEECLIEEEDISITIKPATDSAATPVKEKAPKQNSSNKGMWSFLLLAFLAGLGGVITPCVFPMIPMTVGFFVGGGGSKRSGAIKGIIFGLSVTLIYVLLGIIVALLGSTAATDALGTHWIPNLIFALLFLVFAISFLGAFEITLPTGIANKADQKADKGGYIAAFFVALAMVIVSFSCTGPFVGSILAAAVVGGVTLKPILGMAVFGLAFSLPFVLFSFFPSIMKKMPKSGSWLNVVKVIFAFVMLAFAMKFFYNVDAYFGWGIITRVGFISVWIILLVLLGLYFLGIIRTSHDSEVKGLGWGRMIAAIAILSFAIYMTTGLFGAPLKTLSGILPPQDGTTISLSQPAVAVQGEAPVSSAYSSLPSYSNIEDAVAASKKEGKPIFLYFKSHTCSVCKVMESSVLNREEVLSILREKYIIANLYIDDKTPDTEEKTLGRKLRKYQTTHFGSASQPLYVIIDSNEKTLSGPVAKSSVEEFLNFLK